MSFWSGLGHAYDDATNWGSAWHDFWHWVNPPYQSIPQTGSVHMGNGETYPSFTMPGTPSADAPAAAGIPGGLPAEASASGAPGLQDYLSQFNYGASVPNAVPGISKEYQAYLNATTQAQMAPIEALYNAGMGELNKRSTEAQGLLKALPGQLTDITNRQTAGLEKTAQGLGAQVGNFGPMNLADIGMTPTVGIEPAIGAMADIQASRLADVPYLNVGQRQWSGQQALALNVARQEQEAQIRQQQQQDMAQLAVANMQEQGTNARFNASQHNDAVSNWYAMQAKDPSAQGSLVGFGTFATPSRGQALIAQPGLVTSLKTSWPQSWTQGQQLVAAASDPNNKDAQKALSDWIDNGENGHDTASSRQAIRAQIASIWMYSGKGPTQSSGGG